MGSILSVISVVTILYVYSRRSNASVVGHDTTNSRSAIKTKFAPDQSEETAAQGRKTKRSDPSITSYFHSARNVDARHAIFSDVGGDQHINITTTIDPDPDRRDIGDWMSPLNFKLHQSEIFQIREVGTGEWLLQSSDFKEWRDGPSESLWCPGIPGAGKTVISSIVVDHLQTFFKGCNVAIACIYCNYKEQVEQTAFNLVASLLKQLVEDDAAAYDNVKPLYERHRHKRTRPTFDEIQKALESEIARYSKTYIIVDALDESSDVDGTRGKLLTALRSLGRTISLLVTSRDIASIAQDFHESRHLEILASEQDVRRYIEGRIPRESRLMKHVDGDHALRDEMVKRIIENVQGMFLLARLHMDSLATTISRRELRRGLENLPMEVNATYDETMKRIEGQINGDRKLAERVLYWVIYAYRQLSLAELQHALAVSPGMTDIDPDALVDESILTSVCAGLVVIDKESSTIHLVHYTAQEYFECRSKARFPDAQASITGTCLTYLSFNIFQESSYHNWDPQSFLKDHVLLGYAALNWGHHAHGQVEVTHNMMILQFLQDNSKACLAGQILLLNSNPVKRNPIQGIPQAWGLLMSSVFGLEHVIRCLLENGAELNLTDHWGRTPLSYAVQHGHETAVKLLLTWHNVEVKSQEREGEISISGMSETGEENAKTVQCQKGVYAKTVQGGYDYVLLVASSAGHEGIVKLLLERADINAQGGDYKNALHAASSEGHEGIVRLLLERGADINAEGGHYGSALQAASYKGHKGIVMLVLEKGADINARGGFYDNSLQAASYGGHKGIVKLLLDKEADVNAQGGHHGHALQAASVEGHEGIVMLLLEKGADVNAQGGHYGHPLQAASYQGYERIVELLLEKGADINAQGGHYGNALQAASLEGHEGIVMLLLERGADINAHGGYYDNALQAASYGGHTKIVKLLQEKGADINTQGGRYGNAFQAASYGGHEEIVKLLLEKGADISVQGGRYGTALLAASSGGHKGIVMLLLDKGADINVQGKEYDNALQAASYGGHQAIVKLLMQKRSNSILEG